MNRSVFSPFQYRVFFVNSITRLPALLLIFAAIGVAGQVNVTTYHNDLGRTGQNLSETRLTLGNVNESTFGKLFALPVDGAIYGQPLYLSGVSIQGGTHNVVYVATQHDSVYAFDADSVGAPLWQVSFIDPGNGITPVPNDVVGCEDIVPEIGVTGTPVIDPSTGTLFVVAKTQENGTVLQRLHALDVASGAEKFGGPIVIQGQVAGKGVGSVGGILTFDPLRQNQRAGLLLQNGLIYIAWGSHCDVGRWHGWVMVYDAQSLNQVAAWVDTPNGHSGGIWHAGAPLAADDNYVYLGTGNGTFDVDSGGVDYGDTILKIGPPAAGTLSDVDYFTPFNEGQLEKKNWDLGSGGVMLLPDQPAGHQHLLVEGDKAGTLYLVDRDNMRGFNPNGDQNVQTLTQVTRFILSTPAWWNNYLYVGGNARPLLGFAFDPVAQLFDTIPSSQTSNTFRVPSPTPSVSANGETDAIVWAIDTGGWEKLTPALLYAYDAANLGNLLFASTQDSYHDNTLGAGVKFTVPTVVNGKVYVGTASEVDVLGLLPQFTLLAGGGQTGAVGTQLPVALQVSITDSYTGNPIPGATVTFSDGGKKGKFSNPTAVTDSSGSASTTYTLPTKAQTVTITASAALSTSIQFSETAAPGPAKKFLVVSGNNQTGPPSQALPLPFTIKLADSYGNGVPGVSVSFDDGGAGGSYSANPITTDGSGQGQTTYTTPPTTGQVKVKASATGVAKVSTFRVTVQ